MARLGPRTNGLNGIKGDLTRKNVLNIQNDKHTRQTTKKGHKIMFHKDTKIRRQSLRSPTS